MFKVIGELKIKIFKSKALVFFTLLTLPLLTVSVFASGETHANKNKVKEVLAVAVKASSVTPIPSPTITPTKVTLTPTPTPTLTPTPALVLTPTPTLGTATVVLATSTPTPPLTPTSTPTPTVIPTPAGLNIQIGIDYAGQKASDSYTTSVTPGQTAWEAVALAVGINNLQYTDYGGDLGIFITGFNDVNAAPNQYFEFRVNGVSSSTGVSTYKCVDGDKLDFVLTTF